MAPVPRRRSPPAAALGRSWPSETDDSRRRDLAKALRVLGNPLRIEILDRLRVPHPIKDLRLRVGRREGGGLPVRVAAKQTVRAHVQALEDVGLVERIGADGFVQFALRPARLYAVIEELRRVSIQYAGLGIPEEVTRTVVASSRKEAASGPRLTLVHGVLEGKVFPLPAVDRPLVIGRGEGAHVRMEYDPFVTQRHASVSRRRRRVVLKDAGSKNGTFVNWRRVDAHEEVLLRPGDVVGVGRSLLVFAS